MKTLLKISLLVLAIFGAGLAVHAIGSTLVEHPGLALAGVPFGIVSTSQSRAAYKMIGDIVAKINFAFGANIILNEDFFLSELPIGNNTSNYVFLTLDRAMQGATLQDYPNMKGVKDNDVFIGTGWRILIDNRTLGNTNTNPQTYPSNQIFVASTPAWRDLYTLYNGKWSLEVGRTVYIQGETTRKSLIVPRTQANLAANENSFDGNRYVDLSPYPVMSGRADNKLTLAVTLPVGWAGAVSVGGTTNVIGFEMTGLVVQNGEGFVEYLTGEKDIDAAVAARQRRG